MLLFVACGSDDLLDSPDEKKSDPLAGISIVKLSDYDENATKALAQEQYVLRFADEMTYDRTVNTLKKMSLEKQIDFYETIGYETAAKQLYDADMVLDKIFDIDDDNVFLKEYDKFKQTNKQFAYNAEDNYDLSPYLTFNDEDLKLVGDVNGRVIVGNKLMEPAQYAVQYEIFADESDFNKIDNNVYVLKPESYTKAIKPLPHEPEFLGYSGVTMMIKQGKYQSTMSFGRLPDWQTGRMMVRYASQKQKKFWKRRHPTTYRGYVQTSVMSNGNPVYFQHNLAAKEIHLVTDEKGPAKGTRFTVKMFDFSSGCCNNQKGSIEVNTTVY